MADETILGLVQVSDLHFGDLLPNGDASLPSLLGWLPFMSGQLGHHRRAARDLHRFIADRRERIGTEVLVVSGDLTACGAVPQFALAESFLGSRPPHPAFPLSLAAADWVDKGVPGNHDQWPGTGAIVGNPTPGLAATFPRAFPSVWRIRTRQGPSVAFVMVDSDADVAPVSVDRVFSRGAFQSQLNRLGEILPPGEADEVRVMVIHHSVADSSVPDTPGVVAFPRRGGGTSWRPLEIASDSLLALEKALVDHDIRVLMTGHIHHPRLVTFSASNGRRRLNVLETRCGTTTQRDVYPAALLVQPPGLLPLKPLPPNSLVVHELARRGTALVWKAEVYRRLAGRGFVASSKPIPGVVPDAVLRELML